MSHPQEHGVEPDQAERLAVKLPHLGEHVGLLDPLDDPPVVDADEVEEAGLIGAPGGRRPASSASSAWAVGSTGSEAGLKHKTVVLRWNGTAWTRVPSPTPAGGAILLTCRRHLRPERLGGRANRHLRHL